MTGITACKRLLFLCPLFFTGCSEHPTGPRTPVVSGISVSLNPLNNLSTVVDFDVEHADSARIRYWADGEPVRFTPFTPIRGDSGRIVTLGLRRTTTYEHVVEAIGAGGMHVSAAVQKQAGDLPSRLLQLDIAVTGAASPGYVLVDGLGFGDPGVVYAFDETGEIRWYRDFDEFADGTPRAVETKRQPNGNFTTFLGGTSGYEPTEGRYVEYKPTGEIVRTYQAGPGYYTDNHDLLLTFDDTSLAAIHLFGYDHHVVDLSSLGGPAEATVAGHYLLRKLPDGKVDFRWSAWDRFELADWIEPPAFLKTRALTDFDHPNSLALGADGNYIVSWRHPGEISKIDSKTGAMIWRLGGRNNQFTFVGDPLKGFSAQHSASELENGNILLFDNGARHLPPESRAVEYKLDLTAKTATLVWQYRHSPPIFAPFVSSAGRLQNGNTLVGFGGAARVVEADRNGGAVWQAVIQGSGGFYRAVKLSSLYGR
jgi:hypothetical protein